MYVEIQQKIIITNLIIGPRSANSGRINLCMEWNAIRLWKRLVTLSNTFLLAMSILAKLLLLFLTFTLIKPNISQRWSAVD